MSGLRDGLSGCWERVVVVEAGMGKLRGVQFFFFFHFFYCDLKEVTGKTDYK